MRGIPWAVRNLFCLSALLAAGGTGSVGNCASVEVHYAVAGGDRLVAECSDLRAAQMKVRKLKRQGKLAGPVEVVLRHGVYPIVEPLRFTPEDSGTKQAPITYRAEPAGAATISGGIPIKGWRREGGGVWRAEVPEIRGRKPCFRQLFVDGRRAVRARSPNRGFFHTAGLIKKPEHTRRQADGFYYAGNDLSEALAADPDLLLVAYQSWLSRQYRVKRFVLKEKSVYVEPQMDIVRCRSRYLVENSPLCLDAPGEWYLDRRTGVVRYIPLPGEDMRKARVVVPVTPALLQFQGDPENGAYVEHLRFHGLRFEYADWKPQGHSLSGMQARIPMGFEDPEVVLESGAVAAIGLRHTSIEDCEITRVGAHAVVLLQGCCDNVVRKCHMHDLGGGGVYLFWAVPQPKGRPSWRPRGEFDHIVRNTLDNCYIHDMTHVFHGSVGVLTGPCAADNRITRNEISHGDYTGISLGWGWSAAQNRGYFQDGNLAEYNHVHHLMNYLLNDGGGIYLLGWQKGARVCYNWVHDIRHDPLGHGAKGIYPDQGTSGVLFEGNVVHDTEQGFGGNGGHECIVRNNIFACSRKSGVIGGSKLWSEQVKNNPHPLKFERNIVYQPDGRAMFMRTGYRPDEQVSTNNIYWAGPDTAEQPSFSGAKTRFATFADWQAKGHDAESILADPLFVDAGKRDFRLRSESPALERGFQETDLAEVGLYGDRAWTSLPERAKHAPIAPLPGPGGFTWTYEDELPSRTPTHSGELVIGPDELQHRIEVAESAAGAVGRYLRVVEGKNLHHSFYPFLHYPVGVDAGRVRASFRVKMPAANPSSMYFQFRDHHNPGNKYYQTGPHVEINAAGMLTATPQSGVRLELPRDTWVLVEMDFKLGHQKPKTFELSVTVPGQSPQRFADIPYKDPGFLQAGDVYLVSRGPDGGEFLIDDVCVSTAAE